MLPQQGDPHWYEPLQFEATYLLFDSIKLLIAELLDAALEEEGGTLIARKVGEAVQNTLGAVVGAIDIPLGEPQIQLH